MIMTKEEMDAFIEKIGRSELYDELESMNKAIPRIPYSRYLKAVRVSLVALGYDEKWVDTEFRDALEKKYH